MSLIIQKQFLAVILVSLLLHPCLGSTTTTPPQKIKVGVAAMIDTVAALGSLELGDNVRKGIYLSLFHNRKALQQANLQIELVEKSYTNGDRSVSKVTKEFCDSDVAVVHGYEFSSHALVVSPQLDACGLVAVLPTATASRLATLKSFVRFPASNQIMGQKLSGYAKSKLKAKSAAVIYPANCAYCTDLADSFDKAFKASGGTTLTLNKFLSNETEFSLIKNQLDQVRKADIVFIPTYELFADRVINLLLKNNINKPFLGGDGWGNLMSIAFKKTFSRQKVQAYHLSHWTQESKSKENDQFMTDYRQFFGIEPTGVSALSFEAMNLLLQGLAKLKTADRHKIRDYFQTHREDLLKTQAMFGSSRRVFLRQWNGADFALVGEI